MLSDDGIALTKPMLAELGEQLKLTAKAAESLYDLAIIGVGPAGLAAAVYGGSEGLRTIMIDKRAPGGQVGTSSRIENYLGLPNGLTGADLARRTITQAQRFGVEFLIPQEEVKIESKGQYKTIALKVKPVYIVGGGNSAGQGAMYLSRMASQVCICIHKPDLSSSMLQYLIDQIATTPTIAIVPCTEVVEALGNEQMEQLVLENKDTNERTTVSAAGLFIFIGTKPYTDWIEMDIIKDEKVFVATGRDLGKFADFKTVWRQSREPFSLETCSPGIFAAGDVRAGAMNRVAPAVGEGAMAVSFVHQYLV